MKDSVVYLVDYLPNLALCWENAKIATARQGRVWWEIALNVAFKSVRLRPTKSIMSKIVRIGT